MAYILDTDLRNGVLYPYISIPSAGDGAVSAVRLGAMIQEAMQLIDTYCNDHFEATTAAVRVQGTDRLSFLYVPKRVRSVASVTLYDIENVGTAIPADYWRIHSSFPLSGPNVIGNEGRDGLELVKSLGTLGLPAMFWPGNSYWDGRGWPGPPRYIDVTGAFDWATTPEEVKQATALLVWKMCNSELPPGLDRVDSASVIFTLAKVGADTTGLPEVDALLQRFRRHQTLPWGVPI